MAEMLKRMLNLVRPLLSDSAADVIAEREKLRRALEEVKQAEQRLEDAKTHTQRVLDVIDRVPSLEKEAQQATKVAVESARKWAMSGTPDNIPAVDQTLVDEAADAEQRLMKARMMASGAKAALRGLKQAEEKASGDVSQARDHVAEAIASVMVATLNPHIVKLREARTAYCQSLKEVVAVGHLWGPEMWWWHKYMSPNHYQAIMQHLRELEIRIPSSDEASDRVDEWEKFSRRLTSDPDATLSDSAEGSE